MNSSELHLIAGYGALWVLLLLYAALRYREIVLVRKSQLGKSAGLR